MKRYLLFAGSTYYPCGGHDDFIADYLTLEAAVSVGRSSYEWDTEDPPSMHKYDWYDILDIQLGTWTGSYFKDEMGEKYPGHWT